MRSEETLEVLNLCRNLMISMHTLPLGVETSRQTERWCSTASTSGHCHFNCPHSRNSSKYISLLYRCWWGKTVPSPVTASSLSADCVLKLSNHKNTDTEDTVPCPNGVAHKVNQKQDVHVSNTKVHLFLVKRVKFCLFLFEMELILKDWHWKGWQQGSSKSYLRKEREIS